MDIITGKILDDFTSELIARLDEKISGVYLFGSVAKGTSTEESDIDLLIIYKDVDEHTVLEVASEISFKFACKYGRTIEAIPMSEKEFEESKSFSPFLWEVLKYGKPIFTKLSATEWKLDFSGYLDLAEEYIGYAKDAFKENKLRLSIDAGYNACELLVKALIISTKNPLSSSHGRIVSQFGKLFVLNKKASEEFGKNLNLGLDLRAKARYKPRAQIEPKDAEFIINLASELLLLAKKELSP